MGQQDVPETVPGQEQTAGPQEQFAQPACTASPAVELDADPTQGALPSPSGEGGPEAAPLSKNQQKKLAKHLRRQQLKAEKKAASKAASEQKRQQAKERFEGLSEEDQAARRARRQEVLTARQQAKQEKQHRLKQALVDGQRLVIDLDFPDKMTLHELKSLCQQISYSYGANSRAASPCRLTLTSFQGEVERTMLSQASGFENWLIAKHSTSYLEVYREEKEKLVYLTADSPAELQELDPACIYIIGGLVDRNRHRGICLEKAEGQGIRTGRLPIGEYMQLASSKVLTVNHVVDIILHFLQHNDWREAFESVIPTRKRAEDSSHATGVQEGKRPAEPAASADGAAPLEKKAKLE